MAAPIAMKILDMKAPNHLPVRLIKLNDGTASEFECRFSRSGGYNTFIYVLPDGSFKNILEVNGENLLIDSAGNEWASSDVEFVSTPPITA